MDGWNFLQGFTLLTERSSSKALEEPSSQQRNVSFV
jgi:hypothetical protein